MRNLVNGGALLDRFSSVTQEIRKTAEDEDLGFFVFEPFPFAIQIVPDSKSDKVPKLAVSGGIHGNEVQGVLAIIEVLKEFLENIEQVLEPVIFFVGNPKAVKLGTRYGSRNMNRSFGKPDLDIYETKRAKLIEKNIRGIPYVLDIHTMNEPSVKAFAISPDRDDMHAFILSLRANISDTVIMDVLSPVEGLCLDEWAYLHGTEDNPVVAITLEVGHVDDYVDAVKRAKAAIYGALNYTSVVKSFEKEEQDAETDHGLNVWSEYKVIDNNGYNKLKEGLLNFQSVTAGEIMGTNLQTGEDIIVEKDGVIFFPKYNEPTAPQLLRFAQKYRTVL